LDVWNPTPLMMNSQFKLLVIPTFGHLNLTNLLILSCLRSPVDFFQVEQIECIWNLVDFVLNLGYLATNIWLAVLNCPSRYFPPQFSQNPNQRITKVRRKAGFRGCLRYLVRPCEIPTGLNGNIYILGRNLEWWFLTVCCCIELTFLLCQFQHTNDGFYVCWGFYMFILLATLSFKGKQHH
jgi:hypothetical protein